MKIKNFDLKILAEEKSREYEVPGLTAAVIRDGRIIVPIEGLVLHERKFK